MPSPDVMAATMLRNLPEKTGKSLSGWHQILKKAPLQKHGELVSLLKKEHGVTHGFANLIVSEFRSSDGASANGSLAGQYSGDKAELRPIYDALVKAINRFGKDVEMAPKKAYVSLRRKRQFGLIQPSTRTRVDVGLNLTNTKASKRLEKSGSFNAMVSHRVRLSAVEDVDEQLIAWLRHAYQNAG